MKTKIILEINDGGFGVQRKELEIGDTVVAMSFKKLDDGNYNVNVAAIGGPCNKEIVINYAIATAFALAKMTGRNSALYFQIFKEVLHDCLIKEAKKKADQIKEKIISDIVNSGVRRENAEMILKTVMEFAEKEGKADHENRK